MSAKTGDSNGNNKLDTSETWTTHCTRVVQQADGSPLHNVGTVSAADAIGGPTSASDSADVAIVALATPSPSPTIEASIEPSPEPSTEPTPDETAIVGASEAPTSPSTAPGSTVTAGGGPGPGATASPGAAPTGSDDGPLNLLILVLIVALGTGAIGAYLNARRRQPELADGAFVRSRAGFDDERDPNIGGEPGEPPRYVAPERPVRVRRRPPRSP